MRATHGVESEANRAEQTQRAAALADVDARDQPGRDAKGGSLDFAGAADAAPWTACNETPPSRAREHQDQLHAVPPRELSALGRALDFRRRAVSRRRHEFRHRLRRRHAGRIARPFRQGRSRDPARQGRQPRPRAGRGAAHRRRIRRDLARPGAARRRGGPVARRCKKLRDAFDKDYEFRSVAAVGPRVSGELVQSGTLGVVVAILAC